MQVSRLDDPAARRDAVWALQRKWWWGTEASAAVRGVSSALCRGHYLYRRVSERISWNRFTIVLHGAARMHPLRERIRAAMPGVITRVVRRACERQTAPYRFGFLAVISGLRLAPRKMFFAGLGHVSFIDPSCPRLCRLAGPIVISLSS